MAYVPGYLHDVFISYACADDDHAGGLIRHFRELLANALRARGLRLSEDQADGVDIFLDSRRLKAGSDLTEQVLTSARGSAVFIAFHSLAYMESSWCQREATEFCSIYDPRFRRLNGRLFVVGLGRDGSPAKSEIALIRSRRFRRFYYLHPSGQDFPFQPDQAHVNEDNFTLEEEVTNLAREISDSLQTMRAESPAPRIFLAHTSDDSGRAAEDIKNWLTQKQALVLRASPSDGDWEDESKNLIAKASLFIDLHEDQPPAAAVLQSEFAKATKVARVRWVPRGKLPQDAAESLMKEMEVVEGTLEEFKVALNDRLVAPSERHRDPEPPDAAHDGDPAGAVIDGLLLLVGANRDLTRVVELENEIDRIGCGRDAFLSEDVVATPDPWRTDLQSILELHAASARGVVFVDGDCEGGWADKRLRDLLLLLPDAAPRAQPALCIFPPRNKPRRFRPSANQVIRLDGTQLDQLRDLL